MEQSRVEERSRAGRQASSTGRARHGTAERVGSSSGAVVAACMALSSVVAGGCASARAAVAPVVQRTLSASSEGPTSVGLAQEFSIQPARDRGLVVGQEFYSVWPVNRKNPSLDPNQHLGVFLGYAWGTPVRYASPVGFEFRGGVGGGRHVIRQSYASTFDLNAQLMLPIRPYFSDPVWKSERMLWPDVFVVPYARADLLWPTRSAEGSLAPQTAVAGGLWFRLHLWTSISP